MNPFDLSYDQRTEETLDPSRKRRKLISVINSKGSSAVKRSIQSIAEERITASFEVMEKMKQ